jgi:hypothetical protein
MITPAASKIRFYETGREIGRVEPYAEIASQELVSILKRFVSWAAVTATHAKVAEIFGNSSTAHIKLATDLRLAIKAATKSGTYPNLVLPSRKFTAVMTLSRISQLLELELQEILEKEMQE